MALLLLHKNAYGDEMSPIISLSTHVYAFGDYDSECKTEEGDENS